MKQLFFALAVALLLSACNNNKTPDMGGNMFGNNKGKSPWQNNNNNNNNNNNGNVNNTGGGRWNPALRNAIMQGCLGEVGNDPQAKEKCDCWVGKVEARFPNVQTADQIPEEMANQLATECMQQFGGGNYVPPVNDNGGNDYNNVTDGGVTARTWPSAQRQQWIMGCAGNAQQTFGLTQQQATEYCDCITRKVEQKYTFAEAVRLTAQDFSTPEWEAVRMNCQAALGY